MTLRERHLQNEDGNPGTKLLIKNDDFKHNPLKTQGIWVLFVSSATREDVIRGLRQGVEKGQFSMIGIDEAPESPDGQREFLLAYEEGYITRRYLKRRLEYFERIGFDGDWILFDSGADRHKSGRRMLFGKGSLGTITEFDYRQGGEKPIIRVARLPRN